MLLPALLAAQRQRLSRPVVNAWPALTQAARLCASWGVRYIEDPQAIKTLSIMSKYDLPDADLQALADFMLTLDYHQHPSKVLTRTEASAANRSWTK